MSLRIISAAITNVEPFEMNHVSLIAVSIVTTNADCGSGAKQPLSIGQG
jgi:hypothetical protein